MPSCEILRRATLVRTEVSDERSTSIVKVTRIADLETKFAVNDNCSLLLVAANVVPGSLNLSTLVMETIRSSKQLILKSPSRHKIPEDDILPLHLNLWFVDILHKRLWEWSPRENVM
jgi:hypothetical protein